MAYLTGSVNSFDDLRQVLIDGCVAAGWTFNSGILSKGAAFVRPYVNNVHSDEIGSGLLIEPGTGQSGAALTGASGGSQRLGSTNGKVPAIVFPAVYFLFTFALPDEVYLLLRSGPDLYFRICFGVSDIPGIGGSGLWVDGSICQYGGYIHSPFGSGSFSESGGLGGRDSSNYIKTTGFWQSSSSFMGNSAINAASIIRINEWSVGRSITLGGCEAITQAYPLLGIAKSSWSAESVLLPIRVLQGMEENKVRLVLEVRNARYMRIGNNDPEQVITLGPDRWKVFPFLRKNASVPDGGFEIDHSGTFGWAIRYDGP